MTIDYLSPQQLAAEIEKAPRALRVDGGRGPAISKQALAEIEHEFLADLAVLDTDLDGHLNVLITAVPECSRLLVAARKELEGT